MAQIIEAEVGTKPDGLASVTLLAAYIAIVAWVFHEQTTAWPHVGTQCPRLNSFQ